MPSPTGVTRLVRKKKRTVNGKRNKKANTKRGTWNYLTMGFPSEKKTVKKAS